MESRGDGCGGHLRPRPLLPARAHSAEHGDSGLPAGGSTAAGGPGAAPAGAFGAASPPHRTLREVELAYIRAVLESVGGNKTRAAAILGIDRKSLREKLKSEGRSGEEGA